MTYGQAASTGGGSEGIPIVDMGSLRDGSAPERVAFELHRASCDVGFIYVCNHGIPDALIQQARETGLDFFRRPPEQKLQVEISPQHRGFLKIGGSKMYDGAAPDLKESFVWGYEFEAAAQAHPLRGCNRWPAFAPAVQAHGYAYFEAAHGVAKLLMEAFALGLGLERSFFLKGHETPLSRGSYVYYPPQPANRNADQFGVAAHTDFGVLTVLCQDDVGGLQVENRRGEWIAAPPIPGTLVINVGDLLARWTNDKYRSTPHRVVNTSGRERLSLVVAYDPDADTLIDPHMTCGEGEELHYAPITCGDYLTARFARSFAYRENG